jgi:hypothetical protein
MAGCMAVRPPSTFSVMPGDVRGIRTVLLGYVERRDGGRADRPWLDAGHYQVVIGGERHDAAMTLRAPYDPDGSRVRS